MSYKKFMYEVSLSEDFLNDYKEIIKTRKSLKTKFINIRDSFRENGLYNSFSLYDIKPLGGDFYRLKFIPYRLIIRFDKKNKIIYLEKIFKRKGKADYKNIK